MLIDLWESGLEPIQIFWGGNATVERMNGWVGAVRIAVSPGVVSSLVTLLDN